LSSFQLFGVIILGGIDFRSWVNINCILVTFGGKKLYYFVLETCGSRQRFSAVSKNLLEVRSFYEISEVAEKNIKLKSK